MITLLTGLPGAGKTLMAVTLMRQDVAKGRPVYAAGVDGLDFAAMGVVEWVRPLSEWEDLPERAVLYVDESQQELRTDVLGSKVPGWVEALTRHRHKGVDIVFLSQNPAFLHPFVRKLVGCHVHLLRKWGMGRSFRYQWDEVQSDPQKSRRKAVMSIWAHPQENFKFYKSANVHIVERKIPKRLYFALAVIPLCVLMIWGVLHWMGKARANDASGGVSRAGVAGDKPGVLGKDGGKLHAPKVGKYTNEEYVQSLIPRIAAEPWSAPIFDSRGVASEPEIYCIAMAIDNEAVPSKCECYTEQVTRLKVDHKVCLAVAADGIYNPYRKAKKEIEQAQWQGGNAHMQVQSTQASSGVTWQVQGPQQLGPVVAAPTLDPLGDKIHAKHAAISQGYNADLFGPRTTQY